MSSQNSNTKTLFKSAAKNTGKFLSGLFGSGDVEIYGPKGKRDGPMAPGRDTKKGTINKFLGKFKDKDGYANSREAYQNYLNRKKKKKTGYQRFSGAKVSTGMMSPRSAGRVGAVGAATTFEDTLSSWNSRMRKFAVQRYYASLGKK